MKNWNILQISNVLQNVLFKDYFYFVMYISALPTYEYVHHKCA